jgi:hypothetical protein
VVVDPSRRASGSIRRVDYLQRFDGVDPCHRAWLVGDANH